MTRRNGFALLLIRATFVCLSVGLSWNLPASDLTATYIAGRLAAGGHAAQLYDQLTGNGMAVPGSAWQKAALDGGIPARTVTAYIQTPLWAELASPLAASVDFALFKHIFALITAVATVGLVATASAQWAPRFRTPLRQAALLIGVGLCTPYFAGATLGQTSVILLYLTIESIRLVTLDRAVLAGLLLGAAAVVKITPVWIAVAWIASGRYKAGASFMAAVTGLTLLAIGLAGWPSFHTYLQSLAFVGHTAILSLNNDSILSLIWDSKVAGDFASMTLPPWIPTVLLICALAIAAAAGAHDRYLRRRGLAETGAMISLIAGTILNPIAWDHYFLFLLIPVLMFAEKTVADRKPLWGIASLAVVLMNLIPFAALSRLVCPSASRHPQFWSATLCIALLPLWRRPART